MKLLPRTPRGTWLFAAATWLGGCAIVWWLLPGVPRLVVLAEGACAVGFTADGRWVQGRGNYSAEQPDAPNWDGPFRIWDPVTGRLVTTWQKPDGATVLWPLLSDDLFGKYAIVLFAEDGPDGRRTYLYDLVTGRREALPWSAPAKFCNAYLTVGGRYLVIETGARDSPAISWWDRTTQQIVGTFSGQRLLVVKPNGRWVTIEPSVKDSVSQTLVVREHLTGREDARLVLSEEHATTGSWPEGDYLWLSSRTTCQLFELPSGRPCLPPQRSFGNIAVAVFPELSHAVCRVKEPEDGSEWLVRWNLNTGQEIGRHRLPSGVAFFLPFGRYATLLKSENATVARFRQFFTALPLVGRIISRNGSAAWMIYDMATDVEMATVATPPSELSPDGRAFVYVSPDGSRLEFWDIPPRKPLTWFAIAAVVWALPLAWLARRLSVAKA